MSIPALLPPNFVGHSWHSQVNYIDSSPIQEAFARNAHQEIIQNRSLFWSAFCLSHELVLNKPVFNERFPQNNELPSTQRFVEKIRIIFQKHLPTKTNFSITEIRNYHNVYFEEDETRERIFFDKALAISLTHINFERNIIPTISKLCERLNIGFSKKVITRVLISSFPREEKVALNCLVLRGKEPT